MSESGSTSVSSLHRVFVWRSEDTPGVEIVVGVNAGYRCRMLHESYAVCVVPYDGNAGVVLTRWRYRGRDHLYRQGSIGIEEPGETHTCMRVYSPIRYCMLRLAPEVMMSAAAELGLKRIGFPVPLIGRPALYRTFSRFYDAAASPASALERQTRLTALLRALLAESVEPEEDPAPPAGRRAAEVVREYLEAHLTEPVGLDELARVAGLSRFHLSRVFTGVYGLSPHAYQNQMRLRSIRERLRGGARLDRVEAGFFDQSHLIRHFRDSMGMTPGTFATPDVVLPPLDRVGTGSSGAIA
jgi:AraC-like DNA-binding protein